MECGKEYLLIYDDKGRKVVRKQGIIKSFHGNLLEFESGEILNTNYIVRAMKLDGGKSGNSGKIKEIKAI